MVIIEASYEGQNLFYSYLCYFLFCSHLMLTHLQSLLGLDSVFIGGSSHDLDGLALVEIHAAFWFSLNNLLFILQD